MGIRTSFNHGWQFGKTEADRRYPDIADIEWKPVILPHDWHIYDSRNLYEDGAGWYKKVYEYEPSGELVYIRFDGVYMDSSVYVNGTCVVEWKYGYSTFECEITEALVPGRNEIIVRTEFREPNSRWYSGAGIYRNVWLIRKQPVHIMSDGIYVSTVCDDGAWKAVIDVETDCIGAEYTDIYNIQCIISDIEENKVADCILPYDVQIHTEIAVNDIQLWSPDDCNLYYLKVNICNEKEIIDSEKIRFGFRTIEFRPDTGFILNGKKLVINGVCMHHDLGCLGTAVNVSALRRQIKIMQEMGANAIRTSHNMPAPELLDLADEMGMLINDEAFDMWELSKTKYDYARFFPEWHEKDVASWIRRDRNHPSVIMWSIGNEIYDTHAGTRGQEITEDLIHHVYEHDPRHNAYVTIGSNYMPWENAQKCADIVKLAGYNYAEAYYDEHHNKHKDWIIYGSETSSVVQSRGIYHFPAEVPILDDDDRQCSSLGNSVTSWGADSIEACIADNRDAKYSAGMFIWSGFDYIGEPTPYHTKNCYFGQVDTAGFPKDSYYIYQAEWTDYKTSPMVHIFPYWDFNEGQLIDVMVCSNAPEVELYFNGKSLGRKHIDHIYGRELVLRWRIPYEEGSISAFAYDENNVLIAKDQVASFKDAASLVAEADRYVCRADGKDMVFITISAVDVSGKEVANANNRIEVSVSGCGRLAGLDNGDSTDYDSYKGTSMRLFQGKLLAVIEPYVTPGDIEVCIGSKGMEDVHVHITAEGTEDIRDNDIRQADVSQADVNCAGIEEIPIRKLEIIAPERILNQDMSEIKAEVRILPDNATYSDVEWRVTDDRGVVTNIAEIIPEGRYVTVRAVGDGNYRLRCTTNNGKLHPDIISQLELTNEGIGTAFLNPYEFISASLYTFSEGDISGGNEKGIATSRECDSIIAYDNLDFGKWGSDEITISIFELESLELEFEIWDGIPYEEGSRKLINALYDKPSIWNTYQEQVYRLPERLSGIRCLGFVFHRKAHVKGFCFTRQNKALQRLSMRDADSIYGDTYTLKGDEALGIGNNVSFVYENMNFEGEGVNGIKIYGRTPLDNNTIHIRLENEEESLNRIIEFGQADEYVERWYELGNIKGEYTVTFIFLPGSLFDFGWFKFL